MGKIFGENSILMTSLSKLADLMLINLLWLIGCVPLITIGTSSVALYYCVQQYRVNDAIPIIISFWRAYRSNFKQATILAGYQLLCFAIIAADLWVLYQFKVNIILPVLIIMVILAVFCLLAMGFIFPLQAQFVNTTRQTIKNAWLMSLLSLPKAICVAVLTYLPAGLFLLYPGLFLKTLIVWLLGGMAGIAYVNNCILQSVFRKFYLKEEESMCNQLQ